MQMFLLLVVTTGASHLGLVQELPLLLWRVWLELAMAQPSL